MSQRGPWFIDTIAKWSINELRSTTEDEKILTDIRKSLMPIKDVDKIEKKGLPPLSVSHNILNFSEFK